MTTTLTVIICIHVWFRFLIQLALKEHFQLCPSLRFNDVKVRMYISEEEIFSFKFAILNVYLIMHTCNSKLTEARSVNIRELSQQNQYVSPLLQLNILIKLFFHNLLINILITTELKSYNCKLL